MRAALNALTEELKRLKANGVRDVSVSDESLAALTRAIRSRAAQAPVPEAKSDTFTPPVPVEPGRSVERAGSEKTPDPSPVVRTEPAPKIAKPTSVAGSTTSALPPPPRVKLPEGDKKARFEALLQLVADDPVCKAHVPPGKKRVVGVGNLDARIFFCGDAPGPEEEDAGEPFVGPAGQLLTRMVQGMGLSRADVYIGSIMNWRPDPPLAADGQHYGNRPPTKEEVYYCLPYLHAQLEVVQPELIVALGSTAAQGLLGWGGFKALGEIRGQWKLFAGKPVMVTYHPSYILRNPTNRSKRAIWEDLLKVMDRAALPISEKQRGFFLDK